MEFDTTDFNEEEIAKVNELINSIRKEKEPKKKWWIMPTFDVFDYDNPRIIKGYVVEEQKESYSKSRPPLKSNFNSEEEAKEWLKNYLYEEKLFDSAIMQINNLGSNLSKIVDNLKQHKMISEDDWYECFRMFNESRANGELAEVTK